MNPMNSIVFATKNNNSFYTLEPSKTLIHFAEYDFTYFWEQSVELGAASRLAGGYNDRQLTMVKNLIAKCHPYFESQINSEFDSIVLDCIIEYICHSENIGLEELWQRCITPKNLYEKSIFSRISEYKIGRAINQWANVMRLQEYVRVKLNFIFEGPLASVQVYDSRKAYFDLAFSVAAKELGFPSAELPSVKSFSPSLMPNAAFTLSRVSKGILRRISEAVDNASEPSYLHVKDPLRDQISMDAFQYIKTLTRPSETEMGIAETAFAPLATEVYLPDSFKAILDLEFDKMLENGILLQKCEKCGKYFVQESGYIGQLCNRVNASGKTCREQYGDPTDHLEYKIPDHILERCEGIRDALHHQVEEGVDEQEFQEWSQYLTNMLNNVRRRNSSLEDLESFLDYSDRMANDTRLASKLRRPVTPAPASIPRAGSAGIFTAAEDDSPEASSKRVIRAFVPEEFYDPPAVSVSARGNNASVRKNGEANGRTLGQINGFAPVFAEEDGLEDIPPVSRPEPKKYQFPTLNELNQRE